MKPHPVIAGEPRPRPPERITADHDVSSFACGNEDLDNWLRHRSRSSEGRTARTYVVAAGDRVAGFYCLAAGSVMRSDIPKKLRHNTPDAIPIIVMGRLAVDTRFHGRGFGSGLLRDAILRTLTAAEAIGVRALVVHALDDAAAFYRKYGFVPSPQNARTLVLPIETARGAPL